MTIHSDFLRRHSVSADSVVAAVADNCRFDERVSSARWERFEAMAARTDNRSGRDRLAGLDGNQ